DCAELGVQPPPPSPPSATRRGEGEGPPVAGVCAEAACLTKSNGSACNYDSSQLQAIVREEKEEEEPAGEVAAATAARCMPIQDGGMAQSVVSITSGYNSSDDATSRAEGQQVERSVELQQLFAMSEAAEDRVKHGSRNAVITASSNSSSPCSSVDGTILRRGGTATAAKNLVLDRRSGIPNTRQTKGRTTTVRRPPPPHTKATMPLEIFAPPRERFHEASPATVRPPSDHGRSNNNGSERAESIDQTHEKHTGDFNWSSPSRMLPRSNSNINKNKHTPLSGGAAEGTHSDATVDIRSSTPQQLQQIPPHHQYFGGATSSYAPLCQGEAPQDSMSSGGVGGGVSNKSGRPVSGMPPLTSQQQQQQ
ncbi:hypothetical protein DQ04_01031000, partial [Trypanosoma grayi]|uniref:hypothetical protein n=1 Tax=Trypanosoma grayi TaxID=71804 RepID=UPI0004F49AA1